MEYEKRLMLSERQYLDIISFYLRRNARYPFIHQINHYFDTPDLLLKNNHMVLRIRTILHKRNELTLKIKQEQGDKEVSQTLGMTDYKNLMDNSIIPEGEVKTALYETGLSIHNIAYITSLKTMRLEIKEDDYLIVIDKNEYGSIIDYNLEIESTSKPRAEQVILKMCDIFHLEYKKGYKSKSSRAFEYYLENKD